MAHSNIPCSNIRLLDYLYNSRFTDYIIPITLLTFFFPKPTHYLSTCFFFKLQLLKKSTLKTKSDKDNWLPGSGTWIRGSLSKTFRVVESEFLDPTLKESCSRIQILESESYLMRSVMIFMDLNPYDHHEISQNSIGYCLKIRSRTKKRNKQQYCDTILWIHMINLPLIEIPMLQMLGSNVTCHPVL